ncbi:hypothetical protein SSYRP_v1c04240 [Spiroplasma syrphidicola EA-1]|uniref:Lipoprotein n=2 Tax=Spiroplasma TaxID=2132 RepID=R4U3M7_9MOLU|nr:MULTISPECIES: hypothetical protein [Spiroplasma]AGM25002.1 hypothetical protein SCHRY_v1c04200 [Spiroplasma chrysopicola DF-1]AGM26017.1 hypothetical protein SSYRP_v1c04240 [Spiroplasma syrphidicola EA-1]
MVKLSITEMKTLKAGMLSGAVLAGIAAIITACTSSLTNLVSSGVSAYVGIKQMNSIEGSYKTPNGANLTWSDKNNHLNDSHLNILFV